MRKIESEQAQTNYCSSGKVAFATRSRAKKRAKIVGKFHGIKLFVYRCRVCYCYHMTKAVRRDYIGDFLTSYLGSMR